MEQKQSSRRRRSSPKSVLRLPDLEHAKTLDVAAPVVEGLPTHSGVRLFNHQKRERSKATPNGRPFIMRFSVLIRLTNR